jgi:hypothetical protein
MSGNVSKTFSEAVVTGSAKPATKKQLTLLEEYRAKLNQIVAKQDLEQTRERVKAPSRPFFVDVKSNTYSILGEEDEVSDSPWNALVGSIQHGQKTVNLETFKVKQSAVDKDVELHVSVFTEAIRQGKSVRNYWTDTSNLSRLSKLMMHTLASEYWTRRVGFDALIESSQVSTTREKGESKARYSARQREFLSKRVKRSHNILSQALQEVLTHNHRVEESLALVHLLRTACRDADLDTLGKDIKTIPKLVPTALMLKRIGKIPDVKIKEFKTLFHDTEWNDIKSSQLYTAEERLKELMKTSISFDNIESFIQDLDDIRQLVHDDRLSSSVVSLKKKRLMYASWWKKTSPRDQPMEPLKEVHKFANDEKVIQTFSPFEIQVAANTPGAEEGLTRVKYDTSQKAWYWVEIPDTVGYDPSATNQAGREFVSVLNR